MDAAMKFHGAVFVASLLGSLHCAGMCGPFAAFAIARDTRRASVLSQALYHGGRLLAYTILGALAGALGATLDFGGSLLGIGRVAGVAAGVLLVAVGVHRVLAVSGVRVPMFPGAARVSQVLGRARLKATRRTPIVRSLGIGVFTALLPCGWLYAFVVMAAGTGGALAGASLMLVFWTGTVPILAGIGAGAREFLARTGRGLQVATALLVVTLGLASIAGRWNIAIARVAAASAAEAVRKVATEVGASDHRCH